MIAPARQLERQSGAALILMMLVVLAAASATLLAKLNGNLAQSRGATATRDSLYQAKELLLAYAAVQPDLAGGASIALPCPDIDSTGAPIEGEAHTDSCGAEGVTVIGRLPWRTIGSPALFDGDHECLWYVVSGSYKASATTAVPMINADNNGQLQLFELESGSILEGATPDQRPVAMIIAPRRQVVGQTRQGLGQPGALCSSDFDLTEYFEADSNTGISNASLSGAPYSLDRFIVAGGGNQQHNDQIQTIRRAEIEDVIYGRSDFLAGMTSLGLALAECIANYANNNPGGANDLRLPWPAPVSLPDYQIDTAYDDGSGASLSGRLADNVDDSNGVTGNTIAKVVQDCDSSSVPSWTTEKLSAWRNWKDHFFYVVAESYRPNAGVPSACGQCLTINGAGQYAAIVFFANRRLPALGQLRDAPPLDADTRFDISNYLESANAANHPYTSGTVDFVSSPASSGFNDLAFCIDGGMNVSAC